MNRAFVKISIKKTFVLILLLSCSCGYLESRDLQSALQQKNCELAKNILLKSLKKNINNEASQYNLVQSFVCAGDIVSALKHINVLLNQNNKFRYELLFLKAYLLGETGETDKALETYQMALDINSDIKIKQNMELLLKQSRSGKTGKNKKGKGKNKEKSDSDKNGKEDEGPEQKNENDSPQNPNKNEPQNNKSQKMSQKQIEKIMKEIDADEKKARSQGLKIKSDKSGAGNEKNW